MLNAVVVDYGRGNLFSVRSALEREGARVTVSGDPETVASADRLVLPGVGAFGDAMKTLDQTGLSQAVREQAGTGRPFLGICLGMQLIFGRSLEFGEHPGLGLACGEVRALKDEAQPGPLPTIPNVGWSELSLEDATDPILLDLTEPPYAYFVHSYHAKPEDPTRIVANQRFGAVLSPAIVRAGNIVGCQFHPERSVRFGLHLLRNWLTREA